MLVAEKRWSLAAAISSRGMLRDFGSVQQFSGIRARTSGIEEHTTEGSHQRCMECQRLSCLTCCVTKLRVTVPCRLVSLNTTTGSESP